MRTLNFQEGLREAIERIENMNSAPKLVAVYGWPHSGKSHFISGVGDHFKAKRIEVSKGASAPRPSVFEMIKRRQGLLDDFLYLFHCEWDKTSWKSLVNEDPNDMAEEMLGRNMNLNIGIYNPNIPTLNVIGKYDMRISNPASRIKEPLPVFN